MKAQKSLEWLLREAGSKPLQNTPSADECWQEFLTQLDHKPGIAPVGKNSKPFRMNRSRIALLAVLGLFLIGGSIFYPYDTPVFSTSTALEYQAPPPANAMAGTTDSAMRHETQTHKTTILKDDRSSSKNRNNSLILLKNRGGEHASGIFENKESATALPIIPVLADNGKDQSEEYLQAGEKLEKATEHTVEIISTLGLSPLTFESTMSERIRCPAIKSRNRSRFAFFIGTEFAGPAASDWDWVDYAHLAHVGLAMTKPVSERWGWRAEIWLHQWQTPAFVKISSEIVEINQVEYLKYDSVAVNRIGQLYAGGAAVRRLGPWRLSGGLGISWNGFAYVNDEHKIISGGGAEVSSGKGSGMEKVPDFIRPFSASVHGAMEYHSTGRLFAGVAYRRQLLDLTRSSAYNTTGGFSLYLGVKI